MTKNIRIYEVAETDLLYIITDENQDATYYDKKELVVQGIDGRLVLTKGNSVILSDFPYNFLIPNESSLDDLVEIIQGYLLNLIPDLENAGFVSTLNSTDAALNNGEEFTGIKENVSYYPSLTVAVKTDTSGVLYIEFSPNGDDWDSSIPFNVAAGINEIHRITVTRKYFRVRFVNDSGVNQAYLRLQTIYGFQTQLNSKLDSTIQQDADAIVARTVSEELSISQGFLSGYSITTKFGTNSDIDSGSVPEEVWEIGGTYTGFPTGSPEEFQILCDAGDVGGTVVFQYLSSNTSTAWTSVSILLTGTTTNTGVTGYRCHTANFQAVSSTAFNVGIITIRHITTTANVFLSIQIGRSQSNCSAFTIPAGNTGYVRKIHGRIRSNTSSYVEGSFWSRTSGNSPRLRRPFIISNSTPLNDVIFGGLSFSENTDIVIRITYSDSNNVKVSGGYDIILVKN